MTSLLQHLLSNSGGSGDGAAIASFPPSYPTRCSPIIHRGHLRRARVEHRRRKQFHFRHHMCSFSETSCKWAGSAKNKQIYRQTAPPLSHFSLEALYWLSLCRSENHMVLFPQTERGRKQLGINGGENGLFSPQLGEKGFLFLAMGTRKR